MAVPTTATFDLDFVELAEEACERAGIELDTGDQLRSVRRALNLLLTSWNSEGINFWTVEEAALPLLKGVATYDLPADTADIVENVLTTTIGSNETDLNIRRVSLPHFARLSNKMSPGRPNLLYMDRQREFPTVTVWPVPQNDNYTLKYWRLRRIRDISDGTDNADIHFRFLPAMVAGLSYQMGLKNPKLTPQRLTVLKTEYREQFQMAQGADRERVPMRIRPRAR